MRSTDYDLDLISIGFLDIEQQMDIFIIVMGIFASKPAAPAANILDDNQIFEPRETCSVIMM